jgi:YHS domain-containing protein
MAELRIEDRINETSPWSGKPVQADSPTRYHGQVVGFCNPGCRDKFEQAIAHFARAEDRLERAREPVGEAAGQRPR